MGQISASAILPTMQGDYVINLLLNTDSAYETVGEEVLTNRCNLLPTVYRNG